MLKINFFKTNKGLFVVILVSLLIGFFAGNWWFGHFMLDYFFGDIL